MFGIGAIDQEIPDLTDSKNDYSDNHKSGEINEDSAPDYDVSDLDSIIDYNDSSESDLFRLE